MGLSHDLISQFVKVTNDVKESKKESTVYGKIVKYNNEDYVKLDGSDLLTPITTTSAVKDGERVTVMIKNHTAIVNGNISSPSASDSDVKEMGSKISEFEIIMAYKVSTEDLEAFNATIENLKAITAKFTNMDAVNAEIESLKSKFANLEYVTADDVSALNADVENLKATFGEFTDISTEDLEAFNANITQLHGYTADFTYVSADILKSFKAYIKQLDAEKISATSADLKYANIDFSNIGKAAMEYFYANSGLIQDVTVENGTITGNLVGVTIKGDLLEGGTVVADKLVIKGEDGLYYKLNTNGITTEAEQTDYNSLNGSIITANSITASKISVTDLVAFDATIGGFNITESSIHSGVKSTVDNTTKGIYLDKDGQIAVGDATNFLKYYKDQNGNYKLEISADSIKMGTSNKTIEESINDLTNAVNEIEVGGRNLMINTINPVVSPYENRIQILGQNSSTAMSSDNFTQEITEHGYKIMVNVDGAGYPYIRFGAGYPEEGELCGLEVGKTYTLSCEVTGKISSNDTIHDTAAIHLRYYDDSSTTGTFAITAYSELYVTAGVDNNIWAPINLTFTVSENTTMLYLLICSKFNSASYFAAGDYIAFRNIKLEKGNKPTDWTPAPEDIDSNINNLNNELNEKINTKIDELNTTIEQTSSGIINEVTGKYIEISEKEEIFKQVQTLIEQNSDSITYTFNQSIQDIKNEVAITDFSKYIRFKDGDIYLGNTDSDFEAVITNEKIYFTQNKKIVAYISNSKLYITDAEVTNSLIIGNFTFLPRTNGSLSLRKV